MNGKRRNWLRLTGRCVGVAGLVVFLGLALGCAELPVRDELDPRGELNPSVVLGPGDEVEIMFFYTPDLNVLQSVRRDGKIAMPLIGEVVADGLTPAQLSEKLFALYESELVEPKISVFLRNQWSRRVYVGGQVRRPGAVGMPARMSIMEAIMTAGGPREDFAEMRDVLIVRIREGRRLVGAVDLAVAFGVRNPEAGEVQEPFYLQAGDMVYVGETSIVKLNRWVDQHIHDLLLGGGVKATAGTTEWAYDLSGARSAASWK